MSNFILKVFLCSLLSGTSESRSDKVSTKIQGLSSTNCNIQGLSMTFKVCATPVLSVFSIFVLCHLVTAPTHNTKKLPTIQINFLRLYLHICPGGGGGTAPYMGYKGMYRCEGYGFQAVYSRIGYINQSTWV